jgi:nucleotide-binding universal stress UspA family protein
MTHHRILVALNLTGGRDTAFERALALARTSGAELYLLHAVPGHERFSFRAAERLQRAEWFRARAEAAGVKAQTVEQRGDPAEIVVLHADARAVDLIVMGTERRTLWSRFRQKSVAEQVVRRTKRPTLIVPADDAAGGSTFEHVLVAVDLSPESAGVLETALRLVGGGIKKLTALHAVEGSRWLVPEYRGHLLGEARRRLRDVISHGVGPHVAPKLRIATGAAAETIAAHAADLRADLIVMGRSRRFMHLGSTAVRILRSTDYAVLVVPPTAAIQTLHGRQEIDTRAA